MTRNAHKEEKLKPGASSPGAKQYGDGPTDGPTDEESYRGAMLLPRNISMLKQKLLCRSPIAEKCEKFRVSLLPVRDIGVQRPRFQIFKGEFKDRADDI
jgi:hypothetical protein